MRLTPLEQRFWPKVNKDGSVPLLYPELGPCWQWIGGKTADGYGALSRGGTPTISAPAHKLAYEMHVGQVPPGMQLDHLCRNRACVNPGHLEAVTPRLNTLRGLSVAAKNAVKTHCEHGHPLDEANTYYRKTGRACRICTRVASRRYRQRKSA